MNSESRELLSCPNRQNGCAFQVRAKNADVIDMQFLYRFSLRIVAIALLPPFLYFCFFTSSNLCNVQTDLNVALEEHVSRICQKEQLRKYVQEKEIALNELKAEVRLREEELINLKLVLFGDPEKYVRNTQYISLSIHHARRLSQVAHMLIL